MKRFADSNKASSIDDVQSFPLRKFYFVLVSVLAIISLISISINTENINASAWGIDAEIKVSSLTLILVFLAWLPLLVPWIIYLFPRLRNLLSGLRELGVEEIEASIFRIRLHPGVRQAAESYETNLQENLHLFSADTAKKEVENVFVETRNLLAHSSQLTSSQAMLQINLLASYYDRVRKEMESGHERTRLMTVIASTMWSLMTFVKDFPVSERLISAKGGERLSAYKFLEWEPNIVYLDTLLSRSVGVLEDPFGQYGALLALRRMVSVISVSQSQRELILSILGWASKINYMGSGRLTLMKSIESILE